MFVIVTYASCLICRLFSKDEPNFQVGGDVSQLKPQEEDASKPAANGIKYFLAFVVCLLVVFLTKTRDILLT
jgi:hypothetical protein